MLGLALCPYPAELSPRRALLEHGRGEVLRAEHEGVALIEKVVRLAENMQVGPCMIPAGMQLSE